MTYISQFPQNYLLFSVRNGDELMAATIAIIVHRKILYNFLPGSLRKMKHFSPTVLLIDGLYKFCQQRQIDMLDLGISTTKDGKNQNSLISFKERMGGQSSPKYFFAKQI